MSNQTNQTKPTVEELLKKSKIVYAKIIRPRGQFVPPRVLLTFLEINGKPMDSNNVLNYKCKRTSLGKGRIQYDYQIRMIVD